MELHACPLKLEAWSPQSPRDEWVCRVVEAHSELELCVLDCGELVVPGVALKVDGEHLLIHLERTECEHCQEIVGNCAVPDFGSGKEEYRSFVRSLPLLDCPHCGGALRRRLVLWIAPSV